MLTGTTMDRSAVLPEDGSVSGAWATVFMQDVYIGLEPDVKRGEIKQIAVVQGHAEAFVGCPADLLIANIHYLSDSKLVELMMGYSPPWFAASSAGPESGRCSMPSTVCS